MVDKLINGRFSRISTKNGN